jgi:hypothetical protein
LSYRRCPNPYGRWPAEEAAHEVAEMSKPADAHALLHAIKEKQGGT